jgi:hypothetical protein
MIRLKDILKETEEFQQLPTELKKHFLEIISTYGAHRESMSRKSDIRQVAETLGGIADAAQEYTLREGGDWFDRVTIKRNMNELKKLQKSFEKEAIEANAQEQRLEALYEDMGNVLGRYFEIADVSQSVMKERLGLKECKECNKPKIQSVIKEGRYDADLDKIEAAVKTASSFMSVGSALKSAGIKYDFTTSMIPMYMIKVSGNTIAICNKKYAAGAEREVKDMAIGLLN